MEQEITELPIQIEDTSDTANSSARAGWGPLCCVGCSKPILDRFIMQLQGQHWHAGCLCCCVCKIQLIQFCYCVNSKLYCQNDFFSLYGALCASCDGYIAPTNFVRRALHNVYHLTCFRCRVCQEVFHTGDTIYLCDGNILCRACRDWERCQEAVPSMSAVSAASQVLNMAPAAWPLVAPFVPRSEVFPRREKAPDEAVPSMSAVSAASQVLNMAPAAWPLVAPFVPRSEVFPRREKAPDEAVPSMSAVSAASQVLNMAPAAWPLVAPFVPRSEVFPRREKAPDDFTIRGYRMISFGFLSHTNYVIMTKIEKWPTSEWMLFFTIHSSLEH